MRTDSGGAHCHGRNGSAKACRQPQWTSWPHSRSVSGRTCLVNEIKVEVGLDFLDRGERADLRSMLDSKQSQQ